MFLTDREDELFALDYERMIEGKINYGLGMRFWLKWDKLVNKNKKYERRVESILNYGKQEKRQV